MGDRGKVFFKYVISWVGWGLELLCNDRLSQIKFTELLLKLSQEICSQYPITLHCQYTNHGGWQTLKVPTGITVKHRSYCHAHISAHPKKIKLFGTRTSGST